MKTQIKTVLTLCLGLCLQSGRAQQEVNSVYWAWHEWEDKPNSEVKDIHEILRKFPEAMKDISHPAWTRDSPGNNYFWDQPLFGYYRTTDSWVLRKHAEMLADAKVDAVVFDCSNGSFTWDKS